MLHSCLCVTCSQPVCSKEISLLCSLCSNLVHIECIPNFSLNDFEKLTENERSSWYCHVCIGKTLPFNMYSADADFYDAIYTFFNSETTLLPKSSQQPDNCHGDSNIEEFLKEDMDNDTSKYFTPADFNAFYNSNYNKSFSVFHINCRSLPKHHSDIISLLDSLECSFNVIALTETWLDSNNVKFYPFHGYNIVSKERTSKRGGGIALAIKEDVKYIQRPDISIFNDVCETLFIEIFKPGKNVIIGVCYRPPGQSVKAYLNHLKEMLSVVNSEHKECILMGDFNVDLMKLNTSSYSNEFLETLYAFSFLPMISKPTRITDRSMTLIDNIYSNYDDNICTSSGIMVTDISDHLPIFYVLENGVSDDEGVKHQMQHEINNTNIQMFMQQLEEYNVMFKENVSKDPHYLYTHFIDSYCTAFNMCFPLKRVKSKRKQKNKSWYSFELKKMCSKKDSLYKNFIKKPSQYRKECYTKSRNAYTNAVKAAKRKYISCKFQNLKGNISKTWNAINDVLQRHKSRVQQKVFQHNGDVLENAEDIAQHFNNYFINVGNKIASACKQGSYTHRDFLHGNFQQSAFFKPVNEKEIIDFALALKDGKAPGYDQIKSLIVKRVIHIICTPLCSIFNLCFETGQVPKELKIAKVIPIHKKGPSDVFSNYRPISLLPLFSKIFEKCMYNRLQSHLDKHDILYKKQFGFRAKHSTSHALLDFLLNSSKAIENKEIIVGIFLDFKKAFDSINHEILLDKLHFYGIRGVTLDLFRNYLLDRKQFTVFSQHDSLHETVTCGVPQGSILGPLLFLIFINDLANISSVMNILLFADDTNLFFKHENVESLNSLINIELCKVSNWIRANKLQLNYDKTHMMIFNSRKKDTSKLQIYIDGNAVKNVKTTKFLGISIDDDLKWKTHVNEILLKISKTIGVMSKLKHCLPKSILLTIYNSLILPYLSYNTIVWGACSKYLLERINLLQKRAVRIISKTSYDSHTMPLFYKLNILPVSLLYDYQVICFMYSYNNNMLPETFDNLFVQNKSIHKYNTRSANDYRVQYGKTSFTNSNFICRAPELWNVLPNNIKQCSTINNFKSKLKKHLLLKFISVN